MERINNKTENILPSQSNEEFVTRKEQIFRTLVEDQILNHTVSLMEQIGFSPDDIHHWNELMSSLSEQQKMYIVSFPYELKKRFLTEAKRNQNGENKFQSIIDTACKSGELLHRSIGFHATNKDIIPKKEMVGGRFIEEWRIEGTEKDHRNNDLPMAYYSEDYMHLFRTKNPKYIYVVATQQNGSHHRDGSQNWGRASSLAVIDKLDLGEIDRQVENISHEYENKKNAA